MKRSNPSPTGAAWRASISCGRCSARSANRRRLRSMAQSSSGFTDRILSALLVYGYPALAVTLLFGAIGLPLPIGVAAVLAGSLAALGNLSWGWAAAVAVIASFAGDIIAYGIGRAVSEDFLARHGRWIGYSAERKAHIQSLLQRWGGITVIISRTLTSSLSSVVSLFAGVSRYQFSHFLGFALVGRVIWTSAYLGLGYGIGNNIDAASQFLGNLSGLLVGAGGARYCRRLSCRSFAARGALKAVAPLESAAISVPDSAYLHS